MKAVLMSIQPKWVEKIASGEKTIEVRKSRPKLETPFKVYIYCTKEKYKVDALHVFPNGRIEGWQLETANIFGEYCNERVIGEFVCDRIDKYTAEFVNDGECYEDIRRVWVDDDGEEDFEIVTSNGRDNPEDCELLKNSRLFYAEIKKYIGENFRDIPFYGWHISQLKIYDKPKELSEFRKPCPYTDGSCCLEHKCEHYDDYSGKCCNRVERPPQSWGYVEEIYE